MYAIRSYYESGKGLLRNGMTGMGKKKNSKAKFVWMVVVAGLFYLAQFVWNEIPDVTDGKSRITSYNVCYTKLLRPSVSVYLNLIEAWA